MEKIIGKEFDFIHEKIFSKKYHPKLKDKYLKAINNIIPPISPEDENFLTKIISNNMDIEAIEFVLRLKDKQNFLTYRFFTIIYLAEAYSLYFNNYYNEKNKRIYTFLKLPIIGFNLILKLIKGHYILWRSK